MRKIALACCFLLLTPAFAHRAFAQEHAKAKTPAAAPVQPAHYYHLKFIVEQLDAAGKIVNSRSYLTTISTGLHLFHPTSISTGSRVPILTGGYGVGKALVNTQLQYIEVGIDIEVGHPQENGDKLAFDLTAHLSSVAAATDPNIREPVIIQNKWQSPVLIPVGKPAVVFKSDDLNGKGSTQIVVTATRIE
jgi:hypothetical protein